MKNVQAGNRSRNVSGVDEPTPPPRDTSAPLCGSSSRIPFFPFFGIVDSRSSVCLAFDRDELEAYEIQEEAQFVRSKRHPLDISFVYRLAVR